ncbi:MAG: glycosyltransferase family 2 protein [Candidatus Caenarcaniphilales bacterium]|nr:glycosyltransferase family 2 protein [Candidatus Caenarcaniphilales bacterium]
MKRLPSNLDDYIRAPQQITAPKGGRRLSVIPLPDEPLPIFSIITVVFNGAKTLERTMLSVFDQTFPDYEYIIIDGGSADGTLELIKRYETRIALWISEKDMGISDAFNKGIALAKGQIIGIINADDWYDPRALEYVANQYQQSPGGLYHAKLQYWNQQLKKEYVFSADDSKIHLMPTVNHSTLFVDRSVYEQIGLFRLDYRYAMDFEFMARAKNAGFKYFYLDKVTAHMMLDGVSDRIWLKSHLEVYRARLEQGINPIWNLLMTAYLLSLTFIRRSFEGLGLDWLVRFYRERFSVTKKKKS